MIMIVAGWHKGKTKTTQHFIPRIICNVPKTATIKFLLIHTMHMDGMYKKDFNEK